VNSGDIDKFKGNLSRLLADMLNTENKEGGSDDLDATLGERANEGTEIEKLIEEFQEVMMVCVCVCVCVRCVCVCGVWVLCVGV